MCSSPSRRRGARPTSSRRSPGPATMACAPSRSPASTEALPEAVAEVSIHVECTNYGVVEDLHQAVMHALAQYVRHSRMSADEISATVF